MPRFTSKASFLVLALVLASCGPAGNQPSGTSSSSTENAVTFPCPEPVAPGVPDGKVSTAPQMSQAAKDVTAFIASSDSYQKCLLDDFDLRQNAAAGKQETLDPSIYLVLEQKGDANQKEKERVGLAYNKTAADFRAAHPR